MSDVFGPMSDVGHSEIQWKVLKFRLMSDVVKSFWDTLLLGSISKCVDNF